MPRSCRSTSRFSAFSCCIETFEKACFRSRRSRVSPREVVRHRAKHLVFLNHATKTNRKAQLAQAGSTRRLLFFFSLRAYNGSEYAVISGRGQTIRRKLHRPAGSLAAAEKFLGHRFRPGLPFCVQIRLWHSVNADDPKRPSPMVVGPLRSPLQHCQSRSRLFNNRPDVPTRLMAPV